MPVEIGSPGEWRVAAEFDEDGPPILVPYVEVILVGHDFPPAKLIPPSSGDFALARTALHDADFLLGFANEVDSWDLSAALFEVFPSDFFFAFLPGEAVDLKVVVSGEGFDRLHELITERLERADQRDLLPEHLANE